MDTKKKDETKPVDPVESAEEKAAAAFGEWAQDVAFNAVLDAPEGIEFVVVGLDNATKHAVIASSHEPTWLEMTTQERVDVYRHYVIAAEALNDSLDAMERGFIATGVFKDGKPPCSCGKCDNAEPVTKLPKVPGPRKMNRVKLGPQYVPVIVPDEAGPTAPGRHEDLFVQPRPAGDLKN